MTDWPAPSDKALTSSDPTAALREAVVEARKHGVDRDAVEQQLRRLRDQLRAAGRSAEEDVVLEVTDFVAGWASPHMRID